MLIKMYAAKVCINKKAIDKSMSQEEIQDMVKKESETDTKGA